MDTIKQKTVSVSLGDGSTVEVRRMKWKAAREFLKKLAAVATSLAPKLKEAKDAPFDFMAMLPHVVSQSEDLANHILKSSTELKPEAIDALEVEDVIKILGAAYVINYDDELKNFFAGIGQNLVANLPPQSAPEGTPAPATTT